MTDAPETADKLEAAISRGLRAERTLNDPEMTAAFQEVKADLHLQWENCQAVHGREAVWHQLNGINAARGILYEARARGQAAQAELERKQRTAETRDARSRLGRLRVVGG